MDRIEKEVLKIVFHALDQFGRDRKYGLRFDHLGPNIEVTELDDTPLALVSIERGMIQQENFY